MTLTGCPLLAAFFLEALALPPLPLADDMSAPPPLTRVLVAAATGEPGVLAGPRLPVVATVLPFLAVTLPISGHHELLVHDHRDEVVQWGGLRRLVARRLHVHLAAFDDDLAAGDED